MGPNSSAAHWMNGHIRTGLSWTSYNRASLWNAFIESFNGRFRDECLNENWFLSPQEAREIIEHWRIDYNQNRPHGSLSGLTPDEFAKQYETMVKNSQETLIQGAL